MEGTAGKGFRHDLVDDCGDSTMIQATKLTTKLATKKNHPENPVAQGFLTTNKHEWARMGMARMGAKNALKAQDIPALGNAQGLG